MTTVSYRVLAVAAAGILLAGCESLSTFQVPSFGLGGPATTALNLESDPPGAEAKLANGASCRTPCTLPVPLAGDIAVSFTLPGYQPVTVPVQTVRSDTNPGEREFASSTVMLEPNPVYVELQPVPPPPQKRRPTAQRARASKPAVRQTRPAAAPSAPPAPATAPATIAPATPLPPQ
ncbi:hypothetical protein [Rhodoplanes roseus]|uniref:PEGA domain-containing protein n=1 Tax=Rhodoplanes roseus TaxID=29409 RepID=A0A327LBE8_9BRAD|nr:hypothetical protein [Rhodoplanes roseus]RAI45068.1 hypothetical protein CH341_05780 [Rhodoplanes roseus]